MKDDDKELASNASGGVAESPSKRQSIGVHLAQAYSDLPDLGDIKICIESCFEETQYMANICFVVKAELETVWLRACGMQASLGELAYLFAFLAIGGHSALQRSSRPLQEVISAHSSIHSRRACKRHAAIAAKLLSLTDSEDASEGPSGGKARRLTPLQVIIHRPYTWKDLSCCPPLLLRCCSWALLLAYHWNAFEYEEAYRTCRQLVPVFRQYRLAELVEVADREGLGLDLHGEMDEEAKWESPPLRFVAGLRRLHYEISSLVRLSTFPIMAPLCLDPSELCRDQGRNHHYGAADLRIPKEFCLTQQNMRMNLCIVRSTAVSLLLEAEEGDAEHLPVSLAQASENPLAGSANPVSMRSATAAAAAAAAREVRTQTFKQLDSRIHDFSTAKLLPHEQRAAGSHAWQTSIPHNKEQTATSSCALYLRFFQNRTRFEILSRLVGSGAYAPALQAIAMSCALNTLQLLQTALLLLRSPWKVTGWLIWLEVEIEAAIGLFNRTIMHQVASDSRARQQQKSALGSIKKRPHEQDAETQRYQNSDEWDRGDLMEREPNAHHDPTSPSITHEDTDLAWAISRVQSAEGEDSSLPSSSSSGTSSASSSTNQLRRGERRALEAHYPDKSGALFSDFIFGFNSIFKTLQDLHVIPSAAFETAKILKRLQIPHTIRLIAAVEEAEESAAEVHPW